MGILLYLASQIPGFLPEHAFISNSIVLGSVIEFMLLALAMGDRIRIMWQDKVAAEQEVMRLKAGQAAELTRPNARAAIRWWPNAFRHKLSLL